MEQGPKGKGKKRGDTKGGIISFPGKGGVDATSQASEIMAADVLIRHLDDLAKFQQQIENRQSHDSNRPSHSLRRGSLESLQTCVATSGQIVLRDKKENTEKSDGTLGELRQFPSVRGGSKT